MRDRVKPGWRDHGHVGVEASDDRWRPGVIQHALTRLCQAHINAHPGISLFRTPRGLLGGVLEKSDSAPAEDPIWAGVAVADDGTGAQERAADHSLAISQAHEARSQQVLESFASAYQDQAPEEKLLYELAAREQPLVEALRQAETTLAARLLVSTHDAALALALGRALHELVRLKSALLKRTESALSTAATLRAQRAFLRRHSGANT